jgi:hypothetical protein
MKNDPLVTLYEGVVTDPIEEAISPKVAYAQILRYADIAMQTHPHDENIHRIVLIVKQLMALGA